jgi:putative Mg2+ transporter-C (MgtC) family protein
MALTETEIVARLVLAAFLGALVGIERDIHRKPAGMRTHGLICMGAALFTVVSGDFISDPARIASGIVTGIGFLAAGVIFRAENRVRGITTAAEMWVLAAVGIAVGAGMYFAGVATVIIVLLLLVPGKALEKDVEQIAEKKKSRGEKK